MKRLIFLSGLFFACSSVPRVPEATKIPLAVEQAPQQRARYEAFGQEYVVAAQGAAAGLAAQKMFDLGGNIADAAAAATFAISVERPHSTGLGGGGFLLFYQANTQKVFALDFRERAPLAANRNMYLDSRGEVIAKRSLDGIHSVATPGLVAGILQFHKRFGRLPRAKVMEPAIRLAEEGFSVYPSLAAALENRKELLAEYPATRAIFLKADGSPFREGEILVQKDLGKSLRLISQQGERAFYRGKIAARMLGESRRLGGILSAKDLSEYHVKWREPVRSIFRGYQLFSMPPPSSGGMHVAQILNILENDSALEDNILSAEGVHLAASAMQLAFADRALYAGDPDFVEVPVGWITSKKYAAELRATILDRARGADEIRPGAAPKEPSFSTTHFSLMDSDGNAIASTQTINYLFGSGVVAPGTGILLNDEMDDFSAKPGSANIYGAIGGEANAIAPGKRPLSSMSPTILLKDGRAIFVLGAPGGTRIITCVAQTILKYLVQRMPLYEAVNSIRFHHQWRPDVLSIDAPGPGYKIEEELRSKGYTLRVSPGAVACQVEAVAREGDRLHGVADARDAGIALGR